MGSFFNPPSHLDFLKHKTPLLSGFPKQKIPHPPGFPERKIFHFIYFKYKIRTTTPRRCSFSISKAFANIKNSIAWNSKKKGGTMRKSERVHPLCPMDNTHGILKRHAENALAACSTVLRTMGLQRGYHCICCRNRPRTFSFCCFRNNLRFQKFFRGTDGYKFLSSIYDEEGMFGPKFFGIIFFS